MPIQNVQDLCQAIDDGQRFKYLCFWGHTPKGNAITKAVFSQWWQRHPFEVDGVRYATAEHFMMAGKARLFEDHDALMDILNAKHPNEAKKIGRRVRNFDNAAWEAHRMQIVIDGNTAKFGQHPELKTFLLGTGNRILVEASPRDRIWGIGYAEKDPQALNPHQWNGLNLLGFALMTTRWSLGRP